MTTLYSVITALAFFIMPAQTTLYDENLSPVVNLPAGYFVMQAESDAPDGYIAVVYDDLKGFVKSSDVTAVDYTPVTKYETTVKFVCDNDGQPVNLRSAPERSAEILSVLEPATSGHAYGTMAGDALIAGAGELWYYVNANGVRGYCYSAHVKADTTPPNIIEKEPTEDPPDNPVDTEPVEPAVPETMSKTAAIIFIAALCIPVPFVMFYMFKKPKSKDDRRSDNTDPNYKA